jgi:hypothetical protein
MHEVSVPRYEQCMPLIHPIQVHDLNPTSFQHASSPGNEDSALKSCIIRPCGMQRLVQFTQKYRRDKLRIMIILSATSYGVPLD